MRPKADIVIERVPAFQEETAPGAYYAPPSQDASRPGVFYANHYDIKATPKYGMRAGSKAHIQTIGSPMTSGQTKAVIG